VHLDAEILKDLDVRTTEVQPRLYSSSIKIPGVIKVDPDRRVYISAPLRARILVLDAPPHATIQAGQRLALLEVVDPDVRRLQVRAVEIRAELLAARTKRNRTRRYKEALGNKGEAVAEELQRVKVDLEVLEAKVRSVKSALEAVLASLKVAGLSSAQLEALEGRGKTVTRIGLYAPRLASKPDLEIISRPVHPGQTVAAGAKLFELVALDLLLVVGEAFEADLPAVRRASRENLQIDLLLPAEGRRVEGLEVFSIESALDGEERITHFLLRLPNRVIAEKKEGGHRYLDWEHRAGSRVQILVAQQKPEMCFVLPAEALVREGGRQWVYRLHDDGCDQVAVRVEFSNEREVVIPLGSGLSPGDRVVIRGALKVHLALKQSRGKQSSAGEHGHGHQH
jgi:hypothetical protein